MSLNSKKKHFNNFIIFFLKCSYFITGFVNPHWLIDSFYMAYNEIYKIECILEV